MVSLAWAEMVLRDQDMPPDELCVVLTTPDRELVSHHIDLHLERLEEWLSTQRRSLAAVKRILTEASGGRVTTPLKIGAEDRSRVLPWG